MRPAAVIVCVFLAAVPLTGAPGLRAQERTGQVSRSAEPLERETLEIASGLRCPVCENQSVGDSPSGLAGQMRELIREKLEQGQSHEQIERYFTAKYGEWVLLAPPKRGFNLVAWVLPFAFILSGAIMLIAVLRRWRAAPADEMGSPGDPSRGAAPGESEARDAHGAEDPYLARVRRELEEMEE